MGRPKSGRWWKKRLETEREANKLRAKAEDPMAEVDDILENLSQSARAAREDPYTMAKKAGLSDHVVDELIGRAREKSSQYAPRKVFPSNSLEVHWNGPSPGEVDNGVDLTPYINSVTWENPYQDVAKKMEEFASAARTASYRMWVSSQEMIEEFGKLANAFRPKKIESVTFETSFDEIDVATIGDKETRTIPGQQQVKILDQDGDPVPYTLEREIKDLMKRGILDDDTLSDVLDEYNTKSDISMSGHISKCPYPNDPQAWACVCQPPTIFGPTEVWKCSCCSLPRAMSKNGLCDECVGHEYADPDVLRVEHEQLIG